MVAIPKKIEERLKKEVPVFQKVLRSALDRDVNEADTVVIVTDILERVFGMDKYTEITREYAIKNTYVDLAVKLEGKLEYLIEVKAIGTSLKENHLRQAVDYAAKEGVRWALLTNGVNWELHRVVVQGQVTNEQVLSFNFLELTTKKEDLELLFMLCRRGVSKSLMEEFYERQQACNPFVVGAVLSSDPVIGLVRRQLRQINPGLKVTDEELTSIVTNEVIKRDVQYGEQGIEAQKRVHREMGKIERNKRNKKTKAKKIPSDTASSFSDPANEENDPEGSVDDLDV